MTDYVLPVIVAAIVLYGLIQKVPVFHCFLSGGSEGIQTAVKILPTFVGLITAVEMFQASGGMELLTTWFSPLAGWVGLPPEVVPLILMHPISGSGATAVLTDLYRRYGTEGWIGRVASTICGSGETTFYGITVYYGAIGVTKIRHTLWVALVADFAAALLSGVGVLLL